MKTKTQTTKQMFNLSQRSEENTNTQRTVVMLSSEYGMFKHISGNRDLSESNIQAIMNQLRERGQQQPIIINERNEVIDGQHRLEACKRLKMPIQYIKRRGANLEDVISTNIVGKKWAVNDYINRFVAEGNEDYVQLQKFIEYCSLSGFAPSVAIRIAEGVLSNKTYYMCDDGVVRRSGGNFPSEKKYKKLYSVGDAVKLGKFKMKDPERARERLRVICMFQEFSFYTKMSFVSAIMQCMRIDGIDFERLLESARKYPRKWHNEASLENFVHMFEEVYNWRRKNKLPIVNNPQRRL
jgi:hypothetical protein